MTTPICDFLKEHNEINPISFHMPGHKSKEILGCENRDITEIEGADALFSACGIIAESEKNASSLFGCDTYYSTEGSSNCIRAMLWLLKLLLRNPIIIASRNAHKTFLSAVGLLDIEVDWLESESLLSNEFDLKSLEARLDSFDGRDRVVYITSPDYLGNIADISAISEICKRKNALLCVDNAHGAYLRFLEKSLHPIDLGADICCDSAHKTLPVLTGGAYLHFSPRADKRFSQNAKNALSVFGSTSPSYLILSSLDNANAYIANRYRERLHEFIKTADDAKEKIAKLGLELVGNDSLKIVIAPKGFGYYGFELDRLLRDEGIFVEFSDRDFLVLMLSPENEIFELEKLVAVLSTVAKRAPIDEVMPKISAGERVLSVHDALFSESEIINAKDAEGRILAQFNIACPPAVPIAICGEIIAKNAIKAFEYYNIEKISVIK